MRGISVLLGLMIGMNAAGLEFSGQGLPDSAGWTWFSGPTGKAQWQFYELDTTSQYLSVELLLITRGWLTPPPFSLQVPVKFFSFCKTVTRSLSLRRTGEKDGFVMYFGQHVLTRRDLNFGSYLGVEILGGVGAEWAVHPLSLRIRGAASLASSDNPVGGGGTGGPLSFSQASPPARERETFVVPPGEGGKIHECGGMEDAPFLSPGRYEGELGWPGPGKDMDLSDWFRVNLRNGQVLDLHVFSPQTLCVRLFDSFGREAGWLSGSGQMGLFYQAPQHGVYWVCLSAPQAIPPFTYTVELSIRR